MTVAKALIGAVVLLMVCHIVLVTGKGLKNGAVEKRTAAWAAGRSR